MKFFAVLLVVTGLCGNALAQDNDQVDPNAPVSLPEPDPIDQMSADECRASLRQCLADISAQAAGNIELLNELAQRMGFDSADDMLAADCRSRRGTWSNGECLCTSENEWFTAETEECCVENVRAYGRRQDSCLDSGGSYSCRGGCRCPMGTQLLDGQCQGEAATRQEIAELRIIRDQRVPELEARIRELEAELEQARANGQDQAARIADLESQLDAARNELNSLREELARLNAYVASLDITPPPPPEIPPGTVTPPQSNPVTDPLLPPPTGAEDTDETWCEANPGWCTVIVVGSGIAAAGLGLGICAAAGCFEPDKIEASWGYNR